MRKPLWFSVEILSQYKHRAKQIGIIVKKSNILFFAVALAVFAALIVLWDKQTTSYAHAYTGDMVSEARPALRLLENENNLFESNDDFAAKDVKSNDQVKKLNQEIINEKLNIATNPQIEDSVRAAKIAALFENYEKVANSEVEADKQTGIALLGIERQPTEEDDKVKDFAEKLYVIVGDTPIREMVPFISQRDERVAAFLVGIAKKESSFGKASPQKNGETCYNYWGYKSSGGRGTSLGYACFASAEEAIKVVGDRIEVLVNKNRNTPSRMVDTWKCGTSCKGDPGAPSWVSTVTLYFDKIVG